MTRHTPPALLRALLLDRHVRPSDVSPRGADVFAHAPQHYGQPAGAEVTAARLSVNAVSP